MSEKEYVFKPGYVPVVEATRGPLVENIHYGAYAVVDASGNTLFSGGDTTTPAYARSSLKPLQLTAMVRAGLQLPEDLLSLSAASHSGEEQHLSGVLKILEMHGLTEAHLQNTPSYPYGDEERAAWRAAGYSKSSLAQNCSGKHAAMLATCVINGWDLKTYKNPEHPLQKLIAATIAELTGEETVAITADGCGAPLFAYSIAGLAESFAVLAEAAPDTAAGKVAKAIREYPEMMSGTRRDVAHLMRAVPGVFTKDGAEAFQLLGMQNADGAGIGVALKISDGRDEARVVLIKEILAKLGVPREEMESITVDPILGGGEPVGEYRALKLD